MVKDGAGQVVLLMGEAGIGKSRIVHALHQQIAADPHLRLFYQCSPYNTNSALYPFIRQLERSAGFELGDTDDKKLDKLEADLVQSSGRVREVVALLAALLSIESGTRYPPLAMSPQEQKNRTLVTLLEQLEGLATRQPVLVVFEDVHWMDPTSQVLLDMIVERVQEMPVLVLITYRPDFVPPWTGQAHVNLLAISRLNRDFGATMVRELSGRKELPQEVLQQIVTRADGIPLFVEELTKTVLGSGLLEEQQDRYTVIGQLPEHAIPASLKDSLMARLDQLASVKEVAQIGAVIGREFSYELLAEVSGLSDGDLVAALDRLSQSALIFSRGAPPNVTYLFKHALVQDAAYESLLKTRRQQLHARIAQIMEERFPERAEVEPELLAHHYSQAGLAEEAVTYWRRAGERAVAQSAHSEATEHFEKALNLLKRLPNRLDLLREEMTIQTALGPTLMITKGWAAAEVGEAYTRALELSQQLEDKAELFSISRGLWEFHESSGDLQMAQLLAEQLLDLGKQAKSPAYSIAAHDAMADTLFWLGDFSHSHWHAKEGLALYHEQEYREPAYRYGYDPVVACLVYASWNSWFLGYPDQALKRSREALRLACELSHPASSDVALTWYATLYQFRGEAANAQPFAEEAIAIANDQSFSSWFIMAATVHGWVLAEQDRQEEGRDQIRQTVSLATNSGQLLWRTYQLGLLADLYNQVGQDQEASRLLAEALDIAQQTGECFWVAELHRLRGELLRSGSENDLAEAEACFNRSLEVARCQKAKSLELRAATSLSRLWQNQGKESAAYNLLAHIFDWFTEGYDSADLTEAKALLDELGKAIN